jgi:DNA-binding NarL/FixJ family response regulator
MEESTPIRVILVDDHQHIHEVVIRILKLVDDIRLVGQAYRGDDAIRLCQLVKPDLVLMDVVMPGFSGAQATRLLLEKYPSVRVLALSSFSEYEYIKEMLESGAKGYLVKSAVAEDLVNTIRATNTGNTVLSPEIARVVFSPPASKETDFDLTDRTTSSGLMAEGQTDAQIALALHITHSTVRFHFSNILLKFRVDTRSEMLVMAARYRIV